MITPNFQGRGAYMSCIYPNPVFDNQTAKFFLAHPNLKWIATTTANAASVPGNKEKIFSLQKLVSIF
jgi:hypothetical protein